MKTIIFKFATCNLQSLPRQRSITRTMNSVAGTHIFGFQEADPLDYKQTLFKRWPHLLGIGTPADPLDNRYSCPIGYNRATFVPLSSRSVKIYDGEGGISLTRHLTKATFRHKSSGAVVGVIDLHSVVAHGSKKATRVAMKKEAKKVTFEQTGHLLELGLPVAVIGDFNDLANWFGRRFEGHKVTVVGTGIDKIILIDGDHHRWDVLSTRVVETPGDHDTVRTKVSLSWSVR